MELNKLLGQFLNSGVATGFAGGMAGGAVTSMITSKSGRKLGKNALKLGGIAAVGALAYTAYQRYNQKGNPTTTPDDSNLQSAPAGSAFLPLENDTHANQSLSLILVRAMIAAARSDGRLDAQESQKIFQKIQSLELDNETQSELISEMGKPVDIDSIVNAASTPELAAEIYVASLLAIDVDTQSEESYLSMLALRLQIPTDLVAELNSQVKSKTNIYQ